MGARRGFEKSCLVVHLSVVCCVVGVFFVGGISWKADEASLKSFFETTYGPVLECKIIMDKQTGCSKGYGFVTFADPETASTVKKQGNIFFANKMMNVGDAFRKTEPTGLPQTGQMRQQQPRQQVYNQPFMGQQGMFVQSPAGQQFGYRAQQSYPVQQTAATGAYPYGYYDPYQSQYYGAQYGGTAPQYNYATTQAGMNNYYAQSQQAAWPQAMGQAQMMSQSAAAVGNSGILGDKPAQENMSALLQRGSVPQ
jgi:RNA recognition motif-containing protein